MTVNNPEISRLGACAPAAQRGVVLIWVLATLLLIAGIILAGFSSQQALDRAARFETADPAHARAIANAGIVDAFAWFRRQQVQPVTNFAPQRNLAATPPVNETDDPLVGLVREYEVSPNLWGRYEVRLSVPAEPFTDVNTNGHYDSGEPYTDVNGNSKWDRSREVQDISAERGKSGVGTVWKLASHGFLYARPRAGQPLGVGENVRLATATVVTEIRRLTVAPPAAAAICSDTASSVTIGNRGRIAGGSSGAAVAFASSSGAPVYESGSEVTGAPASTAVPAYDSSLEAVFGVGLGELKSMADMSTPDSTVVPSPLGDYTLTVVDGDIVFDAARPLRGTGIVVVLGNCTVSASSNSFFSGLLWVQGNLTVRAPSYLEGIFIVRGNTDVRGVGGDYAEMNYDDGIVGDLLFLMGQYRHSKAVFEANQDPEALAAAGG